MRSNAACRLTAILLGIIAGCSEPAAQTAPANQSSPPQEAAPIPTPTVWKSAKHPIELKYEAPWKLRSSVTDEDARVSFILNNEPESLVYILLVDKGAQLKNVSLDDLAAESKRILSKKGKVRLVGESMQRMHGGVYFRLRCDLPSTRADGRRICSDIYFRHTGESVVQVQQHFPYTGELTDATPAPRQLVELDQGVKIFE